MVSKASEEVKTAIGAIQSGFGVSASQQLGITFAQNQYDKRVQALTDPGAYAAERKAAYAKLAKAVDKSYTQALEKYTGTGMAVDVAKSFAMRAADNERQIQQQILEVEYPSGANAIELSRSVAVANSNNYPGGMPAAPRRAPARRRAAPRKRAAPRRRR